MTPTKEFEKKMERVYGYTLEDFEKDANDYVNAIGDGRMVVNVGSVAKSGMSRSVKFASCQQGRDRYWYRHYNSMFQALGYAKAHHHNDYYVIRGCGMDMIFATNYDIIHNLHTLGIITKEQRDHLSQQTPTVL